MPDDVELLAIQLPGRELRGREQNHATMEDAAREIAEALMSLPELPTFAFGHSMGGTLAYETTLALSNRPAPWLKGLILAASTPPHLSDQGSQLHQLSDDQLMIKLREIGGTPPQILEDASLLGYFLPRVRADFRLLETHKRAPPAVVEIPIRVLFARDDVVVKHEAISEWRTYSHAPVDFAQFDGGHFFVHAGSELVVDQILSMIRQYS